MFREFAPRPVGEGGRTMRGDIVKTSIETQLIGEPCHGAPLHVTMILASGFVGDCNHELAPGSAVAISLAGLGLVPAQVQWSIGGRVGFKFARPLTLDQLQRLV